MLLFEALVTENKSRFIARVKEIAALLGIEPNWLMAVMQLESNMNPQAVNKYTGATGLIQFMPATAKDLGTTTEALLKMNNVQQLEYVYAYLQRFAGKLKDLDDLYLAVFYPLAIGKDESYVIGSHNETAAKVAQQNPFFSQGNAVITVADIKNGLRRKFNAVIDILDKALQTVKESVKQNPGAASAAIVALITAVGIGVTLNAASKK